mmetsp:Transcript_23377/g.56423  ORF Transcript_23377/g.56423 Transcript_23377/m.56423 type:complete len:203 (-) Transcript_23377:1823-2431(-)
MLLLCSLDGDDSSPSPSTITVVDCFSSSFCSSSNTSAMMLSTIFNETLGMPSTSSALFLWLSLPFRCAAAPPIKSFPPLSAQSVTNSLKLRSLSMLSAISAWRMSNAASRSGSVTNPCSAPFRVSRRSALSALRLILYSALDVNILYGSDVPFVTRSSMSTPMYASSLPRTNGAGGLSPRYAAPAARPAFAPATIPCAPASS